MKRIKTFVFDVNSLASAFIIGSSNDALAFDKARRSGRVVTTHAIQSELADVFLREKFDKYISLDQRIRFFEELTHLIWAGVQNENPGNELLSLRGLISNLNTP